MEINDLDIGSSGSFETAYLKVMTMYLSELKFKDHKSVITDLARIFNAEYEVMNQFIMNNHEKAKKDPQIVNFLNPSIEDDPIFTLSHIWNGFRPESYLNGKMVRMRLNRWDFFESEETGLQIMVLKGVLAVILNFRGKGEFRNEAVYADEVEIGEVLAPQLSNEFPYNDNMIFEDGSKIRDYILSIPKS
jgi:hypothetical protein